MAKSVNFTTATSSYANDVYIWSFANFASESNDNGGERDEHNKIKEKRRLIFDILTVFGHNIRISLFAVTNGDRPNSRARFKCTDKTFKIYFIEMRYVVIIILLLLLYCIKATNNHRVTLPRTRLVD